MAVQKVVLDELYEKYYDMLVLRCYYWINYNAELMPYVEECVQDTFLLALKRQRLLQRHPNITGWLFCTCHNRLRNIIHTHYNRQRKHAYSLNEDKFPELHDPCDSFAAFESECAYNDLLDELYRALLPSDAELAKAFFVEGVSVKSLAKRNGTTEGAVRNRIYRIRKRLKALLQSFMQIFLCICVTFLFLNN